VEVGVGTLAVLGAGGVVLGAALPWLDSGGIKRSAFTLARIASEFGALDTPTRRAAISVLLVTPVVAGFVVLLLGLGRPRLSGLVALPLGVLGLGAGVIGTQLSPDRLAGPYVCLVAGAMCLLGAWGLVFVPGRRSTRREPAVLGSTSKPADTAMSATEVTDD
jgi:hypothetical protein